MSKPKPVIYYPTRIQLFLVNGLNLGIEWDNLIGYMVINLLFLRLLITFPKLERTLAQTHEAMFKRELDALHTKDTPK